jgi:hypothetical protein
VGSAAAVFERSQEQCIRNAMQDDLERCEMPERAVHPLVHRSLGGMNTPQFRTPTYLFSSTNKSFDRQLELDY